MSTPIAPPSSAITGTQAGGFAHVSASSSTPLSSVKLSLAKRKRVDDPLDAASSAAAAGTHAATALTHTTRLRTLAPMTPSQSATGAAPSTPLLTMPSPSSELLPVLHARASRVGPGESTPTSSLLRSASSGITSSSPVSLVSATATAAAASYRAQLNALESAAADRERTLRLTVEELRAAARAQATELTEAKLRAEEREAHLGQVRSSYEDQLEQLQTRMRFIYTEEERQTAKLKERDDELETAQEQIKQQREEMVRLKQQLAASPARVISATHATSSADASQAESEIDRLENLTAMQLRTITELESQVDSLSRRVDDADDDRLAAAEVQARLEHTEARLADAETRLRVGAASQAAAEVVDKRTGEFLAATMRAESLQAENARLKDQRQNAALAAEQLLGVQTKLAMFESERDAAAKIALENEELKSRLREWEESMGRLGVADAREESSMSDATPKRRRRLVSPQPFIDSYHQLQATNLDLQSRCHQSDLRVKQTTNESAALQDRITALTAQVADQEQQLTQNKASLLSLERRTTLLTKEREGLQKVLDAYDDEQMPMLAHRAGDANQSEEDAEAVEQHKALKARVQYLQVVIKELESQLRQSAGSPPPAEPIPSVVALLSQVANLEKQHSHLSDIATDLTAQVEWVNQHYPQLLDKEHGELKVITLAGNPSHQKVDNKYRQQLEAAQKENQILQLQCEEMRQRVDGNATNDPSSADSSPPAASASELLALESQYSARITELESANSHLEKKTQRLKEIFGQKVLEFRNTCYLLTGYKIELVQASSYRLRSMYAESESDQLMFHQSSGGDAAGGSGGLQVLETEFTKRLDGSVTSYLEKMESIPGFLAAVTLQLLEKQTKIR